MISLSPGRLCRNEANCLFVILNEVKNLKESISWKPEILRLTPQNDIATQSLVAEGGGKGGRLTGST
jgi:hypothetical protein